MNNKQVPTGGRPGFLVLGCPAAFVLMADHAHHVFSCAVRGEISDLYLGIMLFCMALVCASLAHDAVELFHWVNPRRVWRKLIDWFFRQR